MTDAADTPTLAAKLLRRRAGGPRLSSATFAVRLAQRGRTPLRRFLAELAGRWPEPAVRSPGSAHPGPFVRRHPAVPIVVAGRPAGAPPPAATPPVATPPTAEPEPASSRSGDDPVPGVGRAAASPASPPPTPVDAGAAVADTVAASESAPAASEDTVAASESVPAEAAHTSDAPESAPAAAAHTSDAPESAPAAAAHTAAASESAPVAAGSAPSAVAPEPPTRQHASTRSLRAVARAATIPDAARPAVEAAGVTPSPPGSATSAAAAGDAAEPRRSEPPAGAPAVARAIEGPAANPQRPQQPQSAARPADQPPPSVRPADPAPLAPARLLPAARGAIRRTPLAGEAALAIPSPAAHTREPPAHADVQAGPGVELTLPDVAAPWSVVPQEPVRAASAPTLQPAIFQRGLRPGSVRAAAAADERISPAEVPAPGTGPAEPAAPVLLQRALAPEPRAPLRLAVPASEPLRASGPAPASTVRRRGAIERSSTSSGPSVRLAPPSDELPTVESTPSPPAEEVAPVDVAALVDRVYEELVRRLAFEREARGHWR